MLSAHNYDIEYRLAALHANADGLSQLPLPHTHDEKEDMADVFYSSQLDTLPIRNTGITRDTMSDPILSHVMDMVTTGRFPAAKNADDELTPYLARLLCLTVQQGCLMWGMRVIVPPKLYPKVLKELHTAHPGVVRMRNLVRSYVWWPSIDTKTELLMSLLPVSSKRAKFCPTSPLGVVYQSVGKGSHGLCRPI